MLNLKIKSLFLLATALFSGSAFCAVVWGWEINNPNIFVQPEDEVVFSATIYNDISSETLSELDTNFPEEVVDIMLAVISDVNSNVFLQYTFDNGPAGTETIRSQFAGVVLEPGESHQFILYTLIPTNGSADIGNYIMQMNGLNLTASTQGFIDVGATNITVVPLPATLSLYVASVGLLLSQRKKLIRQGKIALRARLCDER